MSKMAVVYGFGHDEQMRMPGVVWRAYYAHLRQREAERLLDQAEVALLPNLKPDGIRSMLHRWEAQAQNPFARWLSQTTAAVGDSISSIKAWLGAALGGGFRG